MKTTDFARLLTAFFGNYLPGVKKPKREHNPVIPGCFSAAAYILQGYPQSSSRKIILQTIQHRTGI